MGEINKTISVFRQNLQNTAAIELNWKLKKCSNFTNTRQGEVIDMHFYGERLRRMNLFEWGARVTSWQFYSPKTKYNPRDEVEGIIQQYSPNLRRIIVLV